MSSDIEIDMTEIDDLNREMRKFETNVLVKIRALEIQMLMVIVFGILLPFIFALILVSLT